MNVQCFVYFKWNWRIYQQFCRVHRFWFFCYWWPFYCCCYKYKVEAVVRLLMSSTRCWQRITFCPFRSPFSQRGLITQETWKVCARIGNVLTSKSAFRYKRLFLSCQNSPEDELPFTNWRTFRIRHRSSTFPLAACPARGIYRVCGIRVGYIDQNNFSLSDVIHDYRAPKCDVLADEPYVWISVTAIYHAITITPRFYIHPLTHFIEGDLCLPILTWNFHQFLALLLPAEKL